MHRLCLTGFLALFLACNDSTGLDRVQIDVAVSPDQITHGDTATIIVRYTNSSLFPVGIRDWCVSTFEIANAHGEVVAGRDPMICALVIRSPTVLGPFESLERRTIWTGYGRRLVSGTWVTEPVPAGLYRVYGRLEGRLSAPDTIEVQS
jgi:hypothetical protein